MTPGYQLASDAKKRIFGRLAELLEERAGRQFARLHGGLEESTGGFNDRDVAVWLEASNIQPKAVFDSQMELGGFLDRHVNYLIDVKVLNFASIMFQYAASGGTLLTAGYSENWFNFREPTWLTYLDFAPVARQGLLDLLGASTPY